MENEKVNGSNNEHGNNDQACHTDGTAGVKAVARRFFPPFIQGVSLLLTEARGMHRIFEYFSRIFRIREYNSKIPLAPSRIPR